MFTGIADHCAAVKKIEDITAGKRFTITSKFKDISVGDSIAVNGVCLTVSTIKRSVFTCEVSPETLSVTCIEQLSEGDEVNVEQALRLSDRLGGHLVTGHIDGQVEVVSIEDRGEFTAVEFTKAGTNYDRCLMSKGSVTINGVSLTINYVSRENFTVMLVPQTLEKTTLRDLEIGQWVNLEYDCLAKMVNHQVRQMQYSQQRQQGRSQGYNNNGRQSSQHQSGPRRHQSYHNAGSGQSQGNGPSAHQSYSNRDNNASYGNHGNNYNAGQSQQRGYTHQSYESQYLGNQSQGTSGNSWQQDSNDSVGNMRSYHHGSDDGAEDARGGTSFLRKRRNNYRKPSDYSDQPSFVAHEEIKPSEDPTQWSEAQKAQHAAYESEKE